MIVKDFKEISEMNLKDEFIVINEDEELRIKGNKNLFFKLDNGMVSLFGIDLIWNKWYQYPNLESIYLFSKLKSKILIKTSNENKNFIYNIKDVQNHNKCLERLNIYFNNFRNYNYSNNIIGEKVLIIGSRFSGKNTILRNLVNFSINSEWNSFVLDLDYENNMFEVISSLSIVEYSNFMDFNTLNKNKLALFIGYQNIIKKEFLYLKQINNLIKILNDKWNYYLKANNKNFASTTFINSSNLIDNFNYEQLDSYFNIINPNKIIIIDNDFYENYLKSKFPNIQLINLKKNTGAIGISTNFWKFKKNYINNIYFNTENIVKVETDMNELNVYQIIPTDNLPLSFWENQNEKIKLIKFDFNLIDVTKSVLAVIDYDSSQELNIDDILMSPILMYIMIHNTQICRDREKNIKLIIKNNYPNINLKNKIILISDYESIN